MFQKKQRHILLYLALCVSGQLVSGEQTNVAEQMPTLHESSEDLGKAFVVFFKSLGREINQQAQEWGTKISDYVDSIKSQNSKLFSVEQQTTDNKVIVTIKGFEHIDTSICCDAQVFYNYQNVADKVVINVGPDAKVTVSAYESPLVSNLITVSVEAMIEKIEELQQGDAVVTKTVQSKAQKTVSFTVDSPVNLDATLIEFDAKNNTLLVSIPFVEVQKKSVRVRVK